MQKRAQDYRSLWASRFASRAAGAIGALALALIAGVANAAPQFETIYTFTNNAKGRDPSGELVIDKDGALYGTTQRGGTFCPDASYSCGGTVYRLRPPAAPSGPWRHNILYSFKGGTDGSTPKAGVIRRPDNGILHGTTTFGGNSSCNSPRGCGTVFELIPPTPEKPRWTRRILHRFDGSTSGRLPESRLVERKDGSLYGTTAEGGQFSGGVEFSLTPKPAAPADRKVIGKYKFDFAYNNIAVFIISDEGFSPCSPLEVWSGAHLGGIEIRATQPVRLFGLAGKGGDDDCVDSTLGCGTIYELIEPKQPQTTWRMKVLHSFLGGPAGSFPNDGGVIGPGGVLYGTADGGIDCPAEPDRGCGVVFRLVPPDEIVRRWRYQVLYRFKGGQDGAKPIGRIAIDGAGNVYGVTLEGGGCAVDPDGCGTIYKLTPPTPPSKTWIRTNLYRFQERAHEGGPVSGVLLRGGSLYGVTSTTVYKVTP